MRSFSWIDGSAICSVKVCLWDSEWGAAFWKTTAYAPFPIWLWLQEPERELIADAKNGDIDAMAEWLRRHYPFSIFLARRVLPVQEDFLDAVQSAYLFAIRHFQSFREGSSFNT